MTSTNDSDSQRTFGHRTSGPRLSTLACLALSALSTATLAQTAVQPINPNAGQILRELQPGANPASPPGAVQPLLSAPAQPARADASAQTSRIHVKALVITGNQAQPIAPLQALLADLVGTEQSLEQLQAAAQRLTTHYREHGYAVAQAYLPQQDISNGTITIAILEGRLLGHQLSNQSRLTEEVARTYLSPLKDGEVIQTAPIERQLLLLQDTPGVARARATLQPGASVGTAELLVQLDAAEPVSGNAVVDNHGNRYTGQVRLAGNLSIASPLGRGDQFSLNLLSSASNLNFGYIAYHLPVGGAGLRAGAAYLDARYRLGKEFTDLQAHGSARSTSVFALYPLVRSQTYNLNATLAHERKRLIDQIDASATGTNKTVQISSAGLSASAHDSLGGGGLSQGELTLVLGRLSINSASARALDAQSAQSQGRYSRVSYSARRQQQLGRDLTLSVAVNGQWAGKNLDSSEKFVLGGINGVRAYPQGEASGDEGYRVSLELHYKLLEPEPGRAQVQASVFYDLGGVSVNKTVFDTGTANSRRLAGAGVGVQAQMRGVQLKTALAWRTGGGAPVSVPAGAAKSPTWWLQVGVAF